jgi:hypothetical protein
MARLKTTHRNHLSWDAGVIEVPRCPEQLAFVIVEHDERRFFPVPRDIPWEEVAVAALETRFDAAGWWGIPRRLRIDDSRLIEVIRSSPALDDCAIVEVDALLSMRWARIALEKYFAGEREIDQEYVLAA